MKITNTSRGHRGLNVRGNDGGHIALNVAPGETVNADLYDAHNPVYKGWDETGEMDFGGDLADAAKQSLAEIEAKRKDAEAAAAEAEAAQQRRRGRPPKQKDDCTEGNGSDGSSPADGAA